MTQPAATERCSLSFALRIYYLGDSPAGPGYQTRWHVFAGKSNLKFTVQAWKVTWKQEARELVIRRIKAFADLYALRTSPLTVRLGSARHKRLAEGRGVRRLFPQERRGRP